MDKAQIRITKEIMENKELYLSMAGDKKNALEEYYDRLTPLFNKYYRDLLNETISRAGYDKTLRTHKVDPYIAGGAVQGIAGVGAGIVTAVSADINNQKIDAMRASYKDKVFSDSVATHMSERQVLDIIKKIDDMLDSVETIKEYRDQKIEEEYQQAIKYMKSGSMLAHDIFLSLGAYKDSAEMVEKSKKANDESLIKQVIIISLIFSAFIGLFGVPGGGAGFLGVFCCAFIVNCVMFGSMAYKNRIK